MTAKEVMEFLGKGDKEYGEDQFFDFLFWMKGKTVGEKDGKDDFYEYDVRAYQKWANKEWSIAEELEYVD